MLIRIEETDEVKTLSLSTNNHEWTEDFVELSDFEYDDEQDYYVTDKDTFEYWEDLVNAKQKAEDLKSQYSDLITEDVLNEIAEKCCTDFEDAVYAEINVLERIIEENA